MNMVGMGVTIVLILAVGGVGVWYWLRIKETSSHEKVEDKTPPRIPQEPIFGEDLINSGDIKVDEIKKTSPPAEEPQSESQSPEETIEEVQEVLLKETEEEEEPVETSPVLEEIDAGQYSRVTVEKGQAVRIMTGAAIPKGCDCCVRQEDTDYGEETVRIFRPTGQWQNYCYQGENFKNRTVLLKKGDKIGFIEAGILASMGVIKVKVYRRVRAAVLTTGDEVMAPGKRLIPGKIYDCNQGLLAARMKEFGAELVEVAAIEDRPQAMTAAGEVMALDWGITLQCDTTGKEDASSVGVRSHFIHPVLPEADGTTKNVFPCKVERVIEDVFSYILIVSTKEEARIRVDVTKEQWQQYQKHISGNKIWIGIDEKDVMLLK